ncbi:MAG: LPS export ABC transporter periplasmic protein LptC [Candidatus Melainabacteria bacterium]|nr:LPS export ABC transporter periplasmic protein LptC [Candidatus Melainabacteria bacterium]
MWIFKTEWFKLVLALAIAGSIVGLLWYAQWQAKTLTEEHAKELKENPGTENTTLENYELKEVDADNHLRWILTAATGVVDSATRDVTLTKISVKYMDGPKVKMEVVAPMGKTNDKAQTVTLTATPQQKVIAKGEEGKSSLETQKLELNKKNQFTATGGVNIVMTGVAKVTGDRATGKFAKSELESLIIRGNTHAIIQ